MLQLTAVSLVLVGVSKLLLQTLFPLQLLVLLLMVGDFGSRLAEEATVLRAIESSRNDDGEGVCSLVESFSKLLRLFRCRDLDLRQT